MDLTTLQKLSGLRLDLLCQGRRFADLDTADAYIRGKQYAARRYDWDAALVGNAGDARIQADYYVPLSERQPSVRRDLPKLIVQRLTSMAVGVEQWPEVKVLGDPDAEDYVEGLIQESKLPQRMIEARRKGGAGGTVCLSFAFVNGKPRVTVHQAKHMHPLRWDDRSELILGAVLKVYRHQKTEFVDGKPKQATYYIARYWDMDSETMWDPIPEMYARDGTWATRVQSHEAQHNYGECPVYWCQNLPDSENEDGVSDFDGMLQRFDRINELASATNRGTVANVDPTLVIKDEKSTNSGVVRKGSEHAIFSKGGAQYLELEGTAVKTASDWCQKLEQWCLDESGVVNADPHEIASKAVSGEALKVVYMPMTAQCDLLRGQYGELITRALRGMLRASRKIIGQAPGPLVRTEDGRVLQTIPTVTLPPKFIEETGKDGKKSIRAVERVPGTSEAIQLNWRSYFPPTPADVTAMVTSSTAAKGQLVAQKTATAYVSNIFGVRDVDAEILQLDVEKQIAMDQMAAVGPQGTFGSKSKKDDEDDDEE